MCDYCDGFDKMIMGEFGCLVSIHETCYGYFDLSVRIRNKYGEKNIVQTIKFCPMCGRNLVKPNDD